jgi:hypothetical protein
MNSPIEFRYLIDALKTLLPTNVTLSYIRSLKSVEGFFLNSPYFLCSSSYTFPMDRDRRVEVCSAGTVGYD